MSLERVTVNTALKVGDVIFHFSAVGDPNFAAVMAVKAKKKLVCLTYGTDRVWVELETLQAHDAVFLGRTQGEVIQYMNMITRKIKSMLVKVGQDVSDFRNDVEIFL